MRASYQLLGADIGRGLRTLTAVAERRPELQRAGLDAVVLGDFSCARRGARLWQDVARGGALERLRRAAERFGARLLWQLPLTVKQGELALVQATARSAWDGVDGFVTGDLGLLAWLDARAGARGKRSLLFTSNVVNRASAAWLEQRFVHLWRVRPLMHKRTFVEEPIGLQKDVVVYGNLMLNCSTFCLHAPGDLTENCDYACLAGPVPTLAMEGETVHLLGRSLLAENRLDLLPRLSEIADLASATVMDLTLTPDEVAEALGHLAATPGRTTHG